MQEGWFDHAGLYASLRQTLDTLVEEGSRQGTRLVGDGDDHTVKVRCTRVTDRADGDDDPPVLTPAAIILAEAGAAQQEKESPPMETVATATTASTRMARKITTWTG